MSTVTQAASAAPWQRLRRSLLARRLMQAVPVLLFATFVVFSLLKLVPGDLVLEVDGVPVSSETDPASVLNGPENRKVSLTVRSGRAEPIKA